MSIQGTRQTMVPFFLVPCTVTRGLSIPSQIVQADITHTSGSNHHTQGSWLWVLSEFLKPALSLLLTPKDHFL